MKNPAKKVKATKKQVSVRPAIIRSIKESHKYIFVIGGVMSGVGKGIATSSIGTLLSAKDFRINLVKVDPYLNVDAGTMNPTEHGEVFVLDNGLETDQDMGNYERFLNRDATDADYMTSGMIYKEVIERERALKYGGKCVEAIPHIRDEIVRRFEYAAKISKSDVSIIEIGGTVGDYQNIMFIEASRALITSYINTLCDNPDSLFKQEKIFTTLLNYADHVAQETQKVNLRQERFNNIKDTAIFERDKYVRPWIPVPLMIHTWGDKPVRYVDTGCGASGVKLFGILIICLIFLSTL